MRKFDIPLPFHLLFPVLVVLISSSPLPLATSVSFDYHHFNKNTGNVRSGDCPRGQKVICLQGDAVVDDNGGIDLTSNRPNKAIYSGVGRAVYSDPIPLWDNRTNTTTNFTTEFLFGVFDNSDTKTTRHSDGIAFFLSPYPSIIPPNSSGSRFGLTSSSAPANSSMFVAVEFDSIQNTWDQSTPVDHVGIVTNSVDSKAYANLTNGGFDPRMGKRARIEYNAVTQNLTLFFGYNDNPLWSGTSVLTYNIDLNAVLTVDQVVIGFSSSSTSGSVESHRIFSWKFSTTLIDTRTDLSKISTGKFFPVFVLCLSLVILSVFCLIVFVIHICRRPFNR